MLGGDLAAVDLVVDLLHLLAERLGDRLGLVGRELAGHDELLGVELADASIRSRILPYISGWVNAGSSPSLWPWRR